MNVADFILWWAHFLLGLVGYLTGFEVFPEQFYVGNVHELVVNDDGSFCSNVRESLQELSPSGSFDGDILKPSDGFRYGKARDQYASVTYAHELSPSLIALVASETDVQAAVRFASQCGYSVSIRSGGHSYLGSSSCDSSNGKCLQIDVTNLNEQVVLPDRVKLGPGNRLKDAAEFLHQNGRFVPTGECPGVALGGHMQTGGFGLFTRYFGPFVDRVESFRIVLADGSIHAIATPSEGTSEMNDDIFYAVLGGASGSWGVVTEMTLNAIKDEDYFAVYWKLAYWWDTEEDTNGIVNMMRTWSKLANERKDDPRWSALWSIVGAKQAGLGNRIQLEGFWVAPKEEAHEYDFDFFQIIDDACINCRRFRYINVTEPLSQIWRHRYIRTLINKGTGREFPVPYTRAMQQFEEVPDPDEIENITREIGKLLPHHFSPHFVISEILAFRGAASNRALPWPNDKMAVTLDYFFIPPTQYIYDYDEISKNFGQELIANAKGKDHRMYWAAYDATDMEQDWPKYFESEDKYKRLQQIKETYDPENLFQNKMSIPLPSLDAFTTDATDAATASGQNIDTLSRPVHPENSNNTQQKEEHECNVSQEGTCIEDTEASES